MERLFYHPEVGPTPAPYRLSAESVWFTSADGTRLHGWFVPAWPESYEGELAPTILHAHGNAGNLNSHVWFTEYLAAAGFNIFLFDYRGYGESEGRATTRGPLIADAEAALDALLAMPQVDPSRIGMYGQSLGGSIGLNVMAKRSEIAAAVLESPFASWCDIAANAVGGDPPSALGRTLASILISDSHRPLDAVARITDRPILLVHGDADTIIPASHSRRLKAAGGANVELHELAGGEHNSLRDTNPEIEQIVIEFFQRALAR